MSRIGKKPIELPKGVTATLVDGVATVTGPKGTLVKTLPECVSLQDENGKLTVICNDQSRKAKAMHGLGRSLLQGMVTGVNSGFTKALEIQGVGYRGASAGQTLTLNLGYSHQVVFEVPAGVSVSMPNNTNIVLESCDKQQVGQVAATIRGFRPPEPYKGKGIRYVGEKISLKEGKSS